MVVHKEDYPADKSVGTQQIFMRLARPRQYTWLRWIASTKVKNRIAASVAEGCVVITAQKLQINIVFAQQTI
jgi:hypothetical protein